jgi:histone deacetylase 11
MRGDPLGQMDLTEAGIVRRDEIVFSECITRNVPIVMVLSGGYQKINAPCIAQSITNLMEKLKLKDVMLKRLEKCK